VASGELRLGEAARALRSAVLGMDRATFARAVRVSERAIANLEDDPEANPRLETLQRVFAPFGGKIALAFPGMEDAPARSEESAQRREALRAAVASNRRSRGGS
jgi:DNA-binding XRE family transcriptional regulator